ncbi:MAG: FAD binding domain-containing protein [Myxococcota bacterium]
MTATVYLPDSLEGVRAVSGRLRAGGTDLTELRHKGLAEGPVIDLRDVPDLDTLTAVEGGGLRIGAKVRIARLAADPAVVTGWGGVAAAAGGLATPQIRARASLAGSLLQEVRCWYFRSPEFVCLKKGGPTCYARTGDAVFHSVVDRGPCIAPHPSTLAAALWAYDAQVVVNGHPRSVPELLGDGTDPRRTHAVQPGEVVEAVTLPPPVPGEQAAYFRAIHRARAEWPLVECVVRVGLDADGAIDHLVLALGGVANRPLRFDAAGEACVGLRPDDPKVDDVLANLVGTTPGLDQSAYKALLVPGTVRQTLDMALAGPVVPGAADGGAR